MVFIQETLMENIHHDIKLQQLHNYSVEIREGDKRLLNVWNITRMQNINISLGVYLDK